MAGVWNARRRRWALYASIGGFVMVAVYVTAIAAQGNDDFNEIAPWVLAMLAPAVLSLIATITEGDRGARVILLISAVFSLGIGALSILSIGVGFLVCGVMALFAANQLPRVSQR